MTRLHRWVVCVLVADEECPLGGAAVRVHALVVEDGAVNLEKEKRNETYIAFTIF